MKKWTLTVIVAFSAILLYEGLAAATGVSIPMKAASGNIQPSGLDFSHVTEADLDSVFSSFDHPDTPGCAVGVVSDGNLIFSKGYGTANLDYGIPIRPDSRFMIASISKQFAAAALMMLSQEGLLDLDADLRTYIPALPVFERPITARQIIHHTSGLRDIFDLLFLADIGLDNTTTSEDALLMLSRQQRLNFEPGSGFLYSNSGYFLMSVLVKNLSGMSLREYSHKHFFEPLGMNATHWHDDTSMIVPNRTISYLPTPRGPGNFYRGNMDRMGARGLFTTIEDFAKWDANFIENRTSLEQFTEVMSRPGFTHRSDSINYATGLRHGRYKGLATLGHGGSYMGFRTHYMRFPDYQLGIIVFCNMSNISPFTYSREVADLYLRDVFSGEFREYPAEYHNASLRTDFTVYLEDGDLFLQRRDDKPRPLVWTDTDRFRAGTWSIRFERDEEGRIDRFLIQAPRTGEITFIREEPWSE